MCTYIPSILSSLSLFHLTSLGHHRALSEAPCDMQQLPTSYLFYTYQYSHLLNLFISLNTFFWRTDQDFLYSQSSISGSFASPDTEGGLYSCTVLYKGFWVQCGICRASWNLSPVGTKRQLYIRSYHLLIEIVFLLPHQSFNQNFIIFFLGWLLWLEPSVLRRSLVSFLVSGEEHLVFHRYM